MRNLLNALLMFFCLMGTVWASSDVSAPAGEEAQSTVGVQVEKEGTAVKKEHNYGVFLVVLVVSILFVLSSATALNAMGRKQTHPGKTRPSRTPKTSGRKSKLPEGEERFRL